MLLGPLAAFGAQVERLTRDYAGKVNNQSLSTGPTTVHSAPIDRPLRSRPPQTAGVHARQEVPSGLWRLSEAQGGVVTREQCFGLGLSRHVVDRLLREGTWRAVARGVYRTAAVEADWTALAWGGVLLGGDRARLGPQASAHLHGLRPETLPIDVLVPLTAGCRASGPWRFLREGERTRYPSTGAPPRLTVEDSVLDLTASGTEAEMIGLVTTAVQRRRTQPRRLAAALELRARHPHRRLLRQLLGDVAAGADSALEVSYLRDVERAHGLPTGNRQRSRLGLPFVTDIGYEGFLLLVEVDGRLGHEGMGRFRDMDRDNHFVLARVSTLRYGWIDVVDHPCRVAFQVGAVLQHQGWSGEPSRCRRCTAALDADLWLSA